nr:HAD-IC family P-type ATPase [Saprospiraceae bacterium]
MVRGLSTAEAKARLEERGYNELPSSRRKNIWRIALEVLREPMFLLLISCGVLYIMLGDYREGIIMLSTIFVIIFITFYQYQKTERALEALKMLASPRTMVIRDGIEVRIPGREVVVGDCMVLNEGDRIAADGDLEDSIHLTVDESMLTGESIPVVKSSQQDSADKKAAVYSGTLVVKGKGLATVRHTGIDTQFGKIGISLKNIDQGETRLQKEISVMIRYFFLIGGIICIGIVMLFYFTRGNFIQSLLNGLAAAMSVLPEEFPVVLTIFMALGAWHLSKKNVLTRKPSAIESLGSATVLCSDKTGTITLNKMEVTAVYDTGTMYVKTDFPQKQHLLFPILSIASKASQDGSIDPMEIAIQTLHDKLSTEPPNVSRLIREYEFSHAFLAMTRVHENDIEDSCSVSAKGAPETIFSICKMDDQEMKKHLEAVRTMAERGLRVLAVASASTTRLLLPEMQHEFEFTFRGLIGFEDPIRPEVPQAIRECHNAGIKVIMITGDYPVTARNIAMQTGLPPQGKMITGDELKDMDDTQLQKRIQHVTVFARVIPQQKLRIVNALKANGEIVAMTGDGVNDAPALKAAHIGIAMGNKGTDVAREASSLVLLDDNFASIVAAIRSGRRIFDNLQKAMSYILAIHIPIIGLTMIPAFYAAIPLLLLPLHIVFLEMVIDPACSIAFETEQEEKGIMSRPPRNPNDRFFSRGRMLFSLFQGFLLLAMVVSVYILSIREGHSDGEVRAIAFSALIIGNIFLILTNLSKTRIFTSIL